MTPGEPPKSSSERERLIELARLFLRLGTTAFGGPAAHIAMMEEECVRRRQWLTHEEFLDLLGATNLIPGPNSTEMAIHIGYLRAGRAGLVVAGVCFIVPAALIVLAFAWAYERYGSLPQAAGLLYGIKPVIIAVVLEALWKLGRAAIRTTPTALVGLAAVAAIALGSGELTVLAVAGLLLAVKQWRTAGRPGGTAPMLLLAAGAGGLAALPLLAERLGTGALPFSLAALFLVFLKAGSLLFGSGYVLMAFLRNDLVERLRWLSSAQLLDAVAVGQFTPGPLFTTATFIGYQLGGWAGAAAATVGIFLPAFVFVWLSGPLVPRIRQSPVAGAFMDGVNAASLALMAVVTWELARAAIVDAPTGLLALAGAAALFHFRVNSAWLVLAGGAAGLALRWAGP
jgi:chromate transporter